MYWFQYSGTAQKQKTPLKYGTKSFSETLFEIFVINEDELEQDRNDPVALWNILCAPVVLHGGNE